MYVNEMYLKPNECKQIKTRLLDEDKVMFRKETASFLNIGSTVMYGSDLAFQLLVQSSNHNLQIF